MNENRRDEKKRILVIDDTESVHRDFRKVLTNNDIDSQLMDDESVLFGRASAAASNRHTFDLDTATQGIAGLELVQSAVRDGDPYAVAFVDMRMPPGWDGVTTIEHLWKADPNLQVVICTAYSDHSWNGIVERLGEGDQLLIVKKPFDAAEIKQAALALSSKWKMAQEARRRMSTLEAQVRHRTSEIRSAHEETINCLSAASMYRDKETGAHIRRTGLYCAQLAQGMGWSESDIETIRMTAPMHDVGKIGIPDAILFKPGPLTNSEFRIMETHTVIGARLLGHAASTTLQRASEIALNHHERWDGGGYPRGLVGNNIPIPARMLAIADAYDAMTQDRVYRAALTSTEVKRNLTEGRGSQFDPDILDVFLKLLPEMWQISQENPDEPAGERSVYEEILGLEPIALKPSRWESMESIADNPLTSLIK